MADTTTCPANIGSAGRFARVTTGILALLIGAGLTWTLAALHWDSPWLQISVAIPFFVGMLGLLQAKEKTCVVLAAKGRGAWARGRGGDRHDRAEPAAKARHRDPLAEPGRRGRAHGRVGPDPALPPTAGRIVGAGWIPTIRDLPTIRAGARSRGAGGRARRATLSRRRRLDEEARGAAPFQTIERRVELAREAGGIVGQDLVGAAPRGPSRAARRACAAPRRRSAEPPPKPIPTFPPMPTIPPR